jgi:CelD/BcsL family acetyltransferase involved in cellulose biosynthesis
MLTRIDDAAGFAGLRDEWNELLQASASNCLFLTWEWLSTWWKHLGGDRELCILTVRDGDGLVAIAPFALRMRRWAAVLPVRSVEFLGTGSVGSDYLDVIVRRGREREAVRAVSEYLAREGLVVELTGVKRGSRASELATELKREGWSLSETRTNLCPFITLSGHSWESYLATLGPEHRYNFNRRLRNATKRFDLRFVQARSAGQRRDALAALVALHHLRWSERGGSDGLHTPALLAFHEDVSQRALDRGWLRLFVLSLDGASAAALYGFRYQQAFYFYQSGLDPRFGKHSVGLVAMGLAIKSAIEEGADEFDLLHGDEPYKFHWAKETRELVRLEAYPPGAGAWLYARARELGRTVRRMGRRVLPKPVGDRIAAVRRVGLRRQLDLAGPD